MIVRDPVHGLISFERPVERILARLIDTREVQRLRHIRMLGVSSLVFPGAEHSRFSHAVGTAHVMKSFLARMRLLSTDLPATCRLTDDDEQLALAAAFLHDLGHGPLSHLFEEVFDGMPTHESWTSALVLDPDTDVHAVLREIDPALPSAVERMVHGAHAQPYLAGAVSGTFDVDRCDYLLRDSHMTGVRYGLFDLEWLLRSLRVAVDAEGRGHLAVDGSKGLPAVEGFFLARLFMYQQVYLHKAARAAEWMIRALFARAADLDANGDRVEGFPDALRRMARGERIPTSMYLALDDGTIWRAIEQFTRSDDAVLGDLARRLQRRALFKTATIDDDEGDDDEVGGRLAEWVRVAGFEPRWYARVDRAENTFYESPADPTNGLQVVYQYRRARPLGDASFLIGRLQGQPWRVRRLIFPPEAREQIELARARRRA